MAKVVLDAGHGGHDSGAVGNGLKEKELTLVIVKEINNQLKNYNGISVKLTRSNDTFISLSGRANIANNWGADLFISVHINAGGGVGYEDYRHTSQSSNSNAGKFQRRLNRNMIDRTGWKNRGSKQANFAVLRETLMPAVLSENGFIDSSSDANKLKKSSFIKKIAKAHVIAIVGYFGLKKKSVKTEKESKNLYEVIAGTFSDYDNAKKQEKTIKKSGIDAYLKKTGKYHEVIAGTFSDYDNAKKQKKILEEKDFSSYIK